MGFSDFKVHQLDLRIEICLEIQLSRIDIKQAQINLDYPKCLSQSQGQPV
jgi:hypothetical protein